MKAPLAALAALTALAGCAGPAQEGPVVHTQPPVATAPPTPEPDPGTGGTGTSAPSVSAVIAENLEVPWGLAFLPDGDALLTERDSKRLLRVTPSGRTTVLGALDEAVASGEAGEAGLLGLAVSPDFARDRSVYVYLTSDDDNRVLRLRLDRDSITDREVVLDAIPNGFTHDGGRIAFGPDGFLYVSTGEVGEPELAQDPDSLGGKILRITPDGDPAPGNPRPDSPVWSLGHRNVQGLAWDDEGRLWASEFGSDTYDELNLIEPGNNYGWPEVEGTGGGSGFTDPVLVWPTDDASPSGLAYADGHLWMATLRGNRLWRIKVTPEGVGAARAFLEGEYGRLRTVAPAPNGGLWVTTSNRDGRGDPADEDDRILLVDTGR